MTWREGSFRKAGWTGKQNGFSLMELLVVLAITAVLLIFALPSYQRYVQRGQRVEAIRTMLAVAACQENIRAVTGFYDTTACLERRQEHYEFRISPAGVTSSLLFTLTAEPRRDNSFDDCGSLSLNQAGTRGISGSDNALSACWGGR